VYSKAHNATLGLVPALSCQASTPRFKTLITWEVSIFRVASALRGFKLAVVKP
jgi:hypothetical protein